MKFTVAVLAMAGLMAAGTFSAPSVLIAETKSQWEGVYTKDQADRGADLYAQYCATCHGADLGGGEMAPSLAGGEFAASWNDLSLGELFDRIRKTMPQNSPGSLNRQQNADLLAFILFKGSAPVGNAELPSQSEALNGIKYLAQKPAQ